MNKTSVGIMENDKNEMTSFVFKRDPSTFLRRSIKSFPMFLKTSQRSVIRIMIFRFTRPKKKMEFTKGRELETFEIRNSTNMSTRNRIRSPKIAILSRRLFSLSLGSRGGMSRLFVMLSSSHFPKKNRARKKSKK